jgi:hypothetical protein
MIMENTLSFQPDEDNMFSSLDDIIQGKKLQPLKKVAKHELIQLVKAANPIEFIESEEFLGASQLFPMQMEIICKFFELWCPHCNDIPNIPSAIGKSRDEYQPIRDKFILFEHGICPTCGLLKSEIAPNMHNYRELVLCLGMRSGKSALAAMLSAWILHEYLCIPVLQKKLGLEVGQPLEITFCAASGSQAQDTSFGQLRAMMDSSKWFQDLKEALRLVESSNPKYRREDLYRESDSMINYRYFGIKIRSVTTSSSTQAGRTRLLAVIDELSRLNSTTSKISANEVFRVLDHSLITVRSAVKRRRERKQWDIPDSKMIVVSSPLYSTDKTMELIAHAKKSEESLGFKLPTWEVNPLVLKEDLKESFYRDPLGAKRDFGADPPSAENPFLEEPRLLDLCIDTGRSQMFCNARETRFDQNVQDQIFKYVGVNIGNFKFQNLKKYTMHLDAGLKSDSFCMCIGSMDQKTGNVIIEGCWELRPYSDEDRRVYFPGVLDILLKLNSLLSISFITYDQWNSTEQIQRLLSNNVMAAQKGVNRDDFIKFKQSISTGKIRFPQLEVDGYNPSQNRNVPVASLIYQIKHLNDNGIKVEHSPIPYEHDDMAQCAVAVHRNLVTPELVISSSTSKQMKEIQRVQQIRSQQQRSSIGQVVKIKRFI